MIRTPRFAKEDDAFGLLLKESRFLKAEEDADLLFAPGRGNVGMLANDDERVRVFLHEGFDRGDGVDGVFESGLRDGAIDGSDPGIANGGERFRAVKCGWIGERAAKRIDDNGAIVERIDFCGAAGNLVGKKTRG